MSKLKKVARSDTEKRTYTFESNPETLDKLEQLFYDMYVLGSIGASRSIHLFVDGDGAFYVDIKKKDGELKKSTNNDDYDDEFQYDFD